MRFSPKLKQFSNLKQRQEWCQGQFERLGGRLARRRRNLLWEIIPDTIVPSPFITLGFLLVGSCIPVHHPLVHTAKGPRVERRQLITTRKKSEHVFRPGGLETVL